jgi:protein-S-isoprenylcysteine O-methyltransferase Ste14
MSGSRLPDLGPRGEGWVVLQSLAIAAIIGCGFLGIGQPFDPLTVVGVVLAVAGLTVFGLGIRALGRSLTPLPKPRADAELRQVGIYRLARHPIYGGLLLLAAGWSLAAAPLGLVPTTLLAVIFDLKSRREETWLTNRYPEYASYRNATRHRYLPWLL